MDDVQNEIRCVMAEGKIHAQSACKVSRVSVFVLKRELQWRCLTLADELFTDSLRQAKLVLAFRFPR